MTQLAKWNRWVKGWRRLFPRNHSRKCYQNSAIPARIEVLEERLLLFNPVSEFDPPSGWPMNPDGTTTITYSYSNLLDGGFNGPNASQLQETVEESLALWATYAPLNFVEQLDSGPPPSDFTYAALNHPLIRLGYHNIFEDPPDDVLAHASVPGPDGINGDVHFDSDNIFTLDPDTGIDFREIAVHEIGHALGLGHEDAVTAIMNSFYSKHYETQPPFLHPDDINGIQFVYGSGSGSVAALLAIDAAENRQIATAGEVDRFHFNVTADETYRIRLETDSLSHGKLTLYDTDGSTVLLSGDGLGAGTNPWLTFTAQTSGTYFVDVSGNTTQTGTYSVSYTEVDGLVASVQGTGEPEVAVFNSSNNAELFRYKPYPGFGGGAHVAMGDVNGDGITDVITGAGAGAGPHVRAVSGANGDVLYDIFPYPSFPGGVRVAAGDLNNDGMDDIITAPGAGGGPHILAYSGADGSQLLNFFAYGIGFTGGVFVAAGDINGDGLDDVVTGPGAGGGPNVRAFSGLDASVLQNFFAYNTGFTGGVFVAAGDLDGDGQDDIITGPGAGGGPNVRAFSGATLAVLANFHAYNPGFTGGVRVGSIDLNEDGFADIITGPGTGGGPHVRIFNGNNIPQELTSFFPYPAGYTGGIFVAGGDASLLGGGGSSSQSNSSSGSSSSTLVGSNVSALDSQAGDSSETSSKTEEVFGRTATASSAIRQHSGSDDASNSSDESSLVSSDETVPTDELSPLDPNFMTNVFDDELLELLLSP